MRTLLAEIEHVLPQGGEWCSLEKAQTLASLVVGFRPRLVVEIGVWSGGSLVPMLLAMQSIKTGRAIAIDPWSSVSSCRDEVPQNVEWWAAVDHEAALRRFLARLEVYDLASLCEVWRHPSDSCIPPDGIELLHVDGSHTDQAIRDVDRFARNVVRGGILVLDDVGWEGGGVQRALELARSIGFTDRYPLGTGIVMQRTGVGS